jgi:KDO2-lipid IV(A) lauroyltransferase
MIHIKHFFEAALLYMLFFFFGFLPVERASNIGGWLGRNIGPRMATSHKALRHLKMALPDLGDDEHKKIVIDMWDNLGRVMAEYPHLEKICRDKTQIKGRDVLERVLAEKNGGIFFGAHLSNWEILGPVLLLQYGEPLDGTYRAPNNPFVSRLLQKTRALDGRIRAYPKSRRGGKDLLSAVKNKRYIGILIDQKYNEGMAVPFFGIPAMTNPVFVQLCQKYKCSLLPVQNRRLEGASFEITVYDPLTLFAADGTPLPVEEVIAQAHTHLEKWICENPGQWLWLHRRWNSKKLKNLSS